MSLYSICFYLRLFFEYIVEKVFQVIIRAKLIGRQQLVYRSWIILLFSETADFLRKFCLFPDIRGNPVMANGIGHRILILVFQIMLI